MLVNVCYFELNLKEYVIFEIIKEDMNIVIYRIIDNI